MEDVEEGRKTEYTQATTKRFKVCKIKANTTKFNGVLDTPLKLIIFYHRFNNTIMKFITFVISPSRAYNLQQ